MSSKLYRTHVSLDMGRIPKTLQIRGAKVTGLCAITIFPSQEYQNEWIKILLRYTSCIFKLHLPSHHFSHHEKTIFIIF